MASRFYGVNRGQTEFAIVDGAVTNGTDVEAVANLAVGLLKSELLFLLMFIRNAIIKSNWPPATAAAMFASWGLNRGQTEFDIVLAFAIAALGTVTAAAVSVTQATGTITCATVLATNTATVNGQVFTAVTGAATAVQFDRSGTDAQTATNLAAAISAHPVVGLVVQAAAVGAVVTVTAVKSGTGGNAVTLASSGATLAVSGATLAGGAADTVTVNGKVFTATNTAPTTSEFAVGVSDTACAANLAAAINNSADVLIAGIVTALSALGVVTITAVVPGTVGNAITLASSTNVRLAVSGATLAGGVNANSAKEVYVTVRTDKSLDRNEVLYQIEAIQDAIVKDTSAVFG